MEVSVNYLAVIIAALSTMLVGSIWYTPKVFGTMWAKLAHVNLNKKVSTRDMVWLFGSAFFASLISAYIIAYVSFLSNHFFGNSFLQDSLTTGFWLWLGLVATRLYVHDAFEGRRKKLTLLNTAHEFITIMVMAGIIGLIGIS